MKISEITQSTNTTLQEGVVSSFFKSIGSGLSTEEQLAKDEFTKKFVRSFNDYLQSGLKSGSINSSPPAKRAPPKPKQPTPTGTSTGGTVISSPTNKVTP
jgi:hypothetical protein